MKTISAQTLEKIANLHNEADIVLAVWRDIEPEFDALESVDPREYQIPESQWKSICQRCLDVGGNGFTFVNVGPAAIEGA